MRLEVFQELIGPFGLRVPHGHKRGTPKSPSRHIYTVPPRFHLLVCDCLTANLLLVTLLGKEDDIQPQASPQESDPADRCFLVGAGGWRNCSCQRSLPGREMSGDQASLMEICKKLHQSLDKLDEERYDAEAKVVKTNKEVEIEELKLKVVDLAGVKKPALKKVRMSADTMLQALLGGKHKVTMDLRANLKQVKKEVKEEAAEGVDDWRKNVEDKVDRKKMFETS